MGDGGETYRSDHIGDVRHGSTRGSTEVEDAGARLDPHVLNTTDDGSGELGAERIPHPVLNLGSIGLLW
jgi:hypothetical protein